ncbi:hypothetical protein [Pseudosulfitobacter pseudonitzschiae]|uniref:hypothetical protein n=1 Tax=Pseudosulfitobacter pseudonitzschiae TaxID=1402135 RepID=UPI003B7E3B48
MIRIVIPDSGPLMSLAKVDRLDLLDRFKCPIIVTDAVKFEVLNGSEDLPDVQTLKAWFANAGNRIQAAETTYGQQMLQINELLLLIPEEERVKQKRKYRVKDGGELSIRELTDQIRQSSTDGENILVLFENEKVKNMSFGDHVHLMSHWSLAMAKMKIIPSAASLFDEIEKAGRTAPRNPFERQPEGADMDLQSTLDDLPRPGRE